MSSASEPSVEVLTAEVRVLQVGCEQHAHEQKATAKEHGREEPALAGSGSRCLLDGGPAVPPGSHIP